MKIAIVGAGIIGVTTAYELAADGHEVTVFERRGAAAEETSFANAGLVAPGYVTPWAAPGMPGKVLGYLLSQHAPVKLGMPLSSKELAWMWKWWRACKLETYTINRARMQRLAFYSRQRLHQITADLKLEYDRSDGLGHCRITPTFGIHQEMLQYRHIALVGGRELSRGANPIVEAKRLRIGFTRWTAPAPGFQLLIALGHLVGQLCHLLLWLPFFPARAIPMQNKEIWRMLDPHAATVTRRIDQFNLAWLIPVFQHLGLELVSTAHRNQLDGTALGLYGSAHLATGVTCTDIRVPALDAARRFRSADRSDLFLRRRAQIQLLAILHQGDLV